MSDLMRIGSSAMGAAYAQLQTTGQNIANAATPGYTRREVVTREAGSMNADGWTGRGVDVVTVRRVYDEFLSREAASNKSAAAQDAARSDALARLDRLFSDPSTGLGAAFDDMVAAFGDLAAHPADPSSRSAVLARTEAFANRAVSLDSQLLELRQSAQGRMQDEVRKANDTLSALATVNQRLTESQGAIGAPNALLDQRDKLLADLNGSLRANATTNADGSITVTSPRGEPLVVGGVASKLTLQGDPLDPARLDVAVVRGNGTTLALTQTDMGGALAGLMRFAREDVDAARAQLGRMTAAVAGQYNALQATGLDATGQAGQPLFALGQPTVTPSSDATGTATFDVQVADPTTLKASDYTLSFDGTNYTLLRQSDNVATTFASLPQDVDGLTLSLSGGAPAAGDRFLVRSASSFAQGLQALQTNANRLATAMPVETQLGASNGGDVRAASMSIDAIGPSTGATVTVTFTGPGTFSVSGAGTGNPSGLAYTPGMALSFNGWTATLAGTPAAGDTMTFRATANPAADNRNARAMQALGDAAFVDGARAVDRYAELIGDVGARAQSAQATGAMSQRLAEDAERAQSELSGVNLDEEAARMLQYQQAYQAAAKVIQTANEMFRALLDAAG